MAAKKNGKAAEKGTPKKSPKGTTGNTTKAGKKNVKKDKPKVNGTQITVQPITPASINPESSQDEEDSRKRSSDDSVAGREFLPKELPPVKKLHLTEENPLEKAIEELVMEGEESTESEIVAVESSTESIISDVEQILIMPEISDTESMQDEDPEYLKQGDLEDVPDFFDNFGNVPDVEQVSLDLSTDMGKEKMPKTEVKGRRDLGTFVNPLTGEISSSSEVSIEEPIEVPDVKPKTKPTLPGLDEDDMEEVVDSGRGSIHIPILSEQEMEVDTTVPKLAAEEDAFNQFLELEAQGPIQTIEEIDMEALAREQAARLLNQQTYEFICDLINLAVDRAEYVDPKVILRQNLDKRKLIKELIEKLGLMEIEQRGQQFLNRKCVEYFRRKRSFRPIIDENPKSLRQEMRKYHAAVSDLDKWLIREQETKTITQHNLQILTEELKQATAHSEEEISKLADLIRNTLKRENFDRLHIVVENSLKKMNRVRKEISQVRFQLIQAQHKMATLLEQLHDLEDLGNGLSMRNYESIQTETQALGKKIEERNTEFNKLRYRCHGDVHRIAHVKEKQKMLQDTISVQRQQLQESLKEKQRLREVIFKYKIERAKIRKQMQDLSFQAGLLDKPNLMKDYDVTVEYLEELRQNVKQSKLLINQLNEKISVFEKNCAISKKPVSKF
ncbi:uncharacterized protein LOC142241303 [Haematobia irritans]|uniref:uncharacterized protein LOC142241303 n=1 Tax=Haematobia irritans TaxID=7368 RepID=UPI003F500D4A